MATLSFSFDTGSVPLSRIADAFAVTYGYKPEIDGQPNPESKADFARRMIRRHIIDIVRSGERQAAERSINIQDVELTQEEYHGTNS